MLTPAPLQWIDGELVRLEDLVLHAGGHDMRTPTQLLGNGIKIMIMLRNIQAKISTDAQSEVKRETCDSLARLTR